MKDIKNIVSAIEGIYFEKGFEPFKKPVLYSLVVIIVSYYFYSSASSKYSYNLKDFKKIEQLRNIQETYFQLKSKHSVYLERLPKMDERENFLNSAVTEIASRNNISFYSVGEQTEIRLEKFGLIVILRNFKFRTEYNHLGNFIKDIENNDKFIGVSELLIKKAEEIKYVDVSMTAYTILNI